MMKNQTRLQTITIAALLCAVGIVIPMFAPKIMFGPVSFTLASHVPIFIAMFISPFVTLAVALVTTVGFFFAGFPLVIVLRALSHVVFAMVGAFILKKSAKTLSTLGGAVGFGLLLGLIHAIGEVTVVTLFYFGTGMPRAYYTSGYFISVILLIGLGTVVHSMVDFGIAMLVWKPLVHVIRIPVSAKFTPARRAAEQ